jgi:hypothetical protein
MRLMSGREIISQVLMFKKKGWHQLDAVFFYFHKFLIKKPVSPRAGQVCGYIGRVLKSFDAAAY